MTEPIAEVWLIGFRGIDFTAAYPTQEAAKAAVMMKFAEHWTSADVVKTEWKTHSYGQYPSRQHLHGYRHFISKIASNTGWTGWFVQPVPIASEILDA